MLISIITINYNNAEGMEKTINSVLKQQYEDYEYLVIDGDSTDGSKEILEKYPSINYSISEKDTGIYNAMNKGIKMAQGEYLLFLNSGDFLISPDILEKVIPKIDILNSFIGCNMYIEKSSGRELREHPNKISFSYLVTSTLSHPATFIKRSMFEKYGFYNEENKIVSDWEFFFKTLGLNGESFQKIDEVITLFDMNGISSKIENMYIAETERKEVFKKHLASMFTNDFDAFLFNLHRQPTRRIRYLMKIEKHPFLRKVTTVYFSIISVFIKR